MRTACRDRYFHGIEARIELRTDDARSNKDTVCRSLPDSVPWFKTVTYSRLLKAHPAGQRDKNQKPSKIVY